MTSPDINDQILLQGNKRVISELSPNTLRTIPSHKRRRNSLGFEMASIQSNKFESRIPTMSTSSSDTPSVITYTRQISPVPEDYQDRMLSIQQRLIRKGSVNRNIPIPKEYNPTTRNKNTSNELQDRYYVLCDEFREKASKIDHLSQELFKLKSIHRNYHNKIDTLLNQVNQKRSHLDDFEENIVNAVGTEERMIDLKLKENKLKLDNQYKEFESSAIHSLQEAQNYNFDDIIEQIQNSKEALNTLQQEMKRIKHENDEKLHTKIELQQIALQNDLNPLNEKLSSLQNDIDGKSVEIANIKSNQQQQLQLVSLKKTEIDNVKQQISSIEQMMNSFQATKAQYEEDLLIVSKNLQKSIDKDINQDEVYHKVQSQYESIKIKSKQNENHRRNLQNSIMEYENKIRVYSITNYQTSLKNFSPNTSFDYIIDEYTTTYVHL